MDSGSCKFASSDETVTRQGVSVKLLFSRLSLNFKFHSQHGLCVSIHVQQSLDPGQTRFHPEIAQMDWSPNVRNGSDFVHHPRRVCLVL